MYNGYHSVKYDKGLAAERKGDYAKALKYYEVATAKGDGRAANAAADLYLLGRVCYEKGKGVLKNEAEAVKWYRVAAEQGDAKAQFNLGACYENGIGVAKNEAEAKIWYEKAALQAYPLAVEVLEHLNRFSIGVVNEAGEATSENEFPVVRNLQEEFIKLKIATERGGDIKSYYELGFMVLSPRKVHRIA